MTSLSDPADLPDARGSPGRPASFARWACGYDTSQLQRVLYEPVHHQVLGHARRHMPCPTQILDVGCGTGRLTSACARYYPDVPTIGIDPCTEMLTRAASDRQGAPAAVWLRSRAEALPFRDGVFDLVVSTLSLRHWRDPPQGLIEIGRVTAPGGTIVIADAALSDALAPPTVTLRPGRPRRHPAPRLRGRWPGHLRKSARPSAGLRHALYQAGLRLDHIEPIALPIPLTTVTLIAADKPVF
ncbi:class I SAM-dependent methyltransferase [Actinomadura sp. 9N407]|uniref:class I SAM-dependent methyltransferase n=1 Tax=Actinomadura sp. 9N407 TaxID=3375154 RepID=UPI00379A2353